MPAADGYERVVQPTTYLYTMLLTVTDTNFKPGKDWIFRLSDTMGEPVYIMDDDFYRAHGMESPLTHHHLDRYKKGTLVIAEAVFIDDRQVVISIR